MTDIDSGSRGKKKWLKMGISNGGLSSFARIVHRGEEQRVDIEENRGLRVRSFLISRGGGRRDR